MENNQHLSEPERIRRQKLVELNQLGINAYPPELFEVNTTSVEIKQEYPKDIEANLLGRETYLKDPANKNKSTGLFGPNLEERTNYAGLKAMSQQGQDATLNKTKTFNTVRGAGMGSVLGLLRAGGSDLRAFLSAIARGAKDTSRGMHVKDYSLKQD
jgi:lysyl-tRNA synthetase class II